MTELKNIFDIHKGRSYFKDFIEDLNSPYSYITTSGKKNGVKTKVRENKNYNLFEKGTITVALQGTVLSSFLQPDDFYLQTHVAALIPKENLSLREKIYYLSFIEKYAVLYSFGRKANSTLENLLIPEKHEIPDWAYTAEIPEPYKGESFSNEQVKLPSGDKWGTFTFDELFTIGKAKGPKAKEVDQNPGPYPYITATAENNGVKARTSFEPLHKGNCMTVGHLGNPFYQKEAFSGNNVTYMYPKGWEINQYIGLFLVTVFQFLPEKYNYGNVVGITKMKKEIVQLPITSEGKPDWDLIERYIKSLPYSKYI